MTEKLCRKDQNVPDGRECDRDQPINILVTAIRLSFLGNAGRHVLNTLNQKSPQHVRDCLRVTESARNVRC